MRHHPQTKEERIGISCERTLTYYKGQTNTKSTNTGLTIQSFKKRNNVSAKKYNNTVTKLLECKRMLLERK